MSNLKHLNPFSYRMLVILIALAALLAGPLPLTVFANQISIVPASPFTGPLQCRPTFGPPQCNFRPFDTAQDLAFQGNGSALPAVAKDVIPSGSTIHTIANANDGHYGNGTSWIGNSANSWLKIDLGQAALIDRVTIGRDRTGGFDDRDPGRRRDDELEEQLNPLNRYISVG